VTANGGHIRNRTKNIEGVVVSTENSKAIFCGFGGDAADGRMLGNRVVTIKRVLNGSPDGRARNCGVEENSIKSCGAAARMCWQPAGGLNRKECFEGVAEGARNRLGKC